MARSILNSKVSNFVTVDRISNENVAIRTATILSLVLKFQVDRSEKNRASKKSVKIEKKKKKKKKIEYLQ